MAENSKIQWTDHTFNAWVGCTKIKGKGGAPSACDFCYAEKWAKRTGQPQLWNGKRRRTTESYWRQPLKWNDAAKKAGKRARVFCCSLADVFDNQVPKQWRADLFALIRATPWLDWQLLTKRPQNIAKMLPPDWGDGYPNVWLGTTVENETETRRIVHLLKVRAVIHFLSMEPLLSAVDIAPYLSAYWTAINCPQSKRPDGSWTGQRINLVIIGGESGGKKKVRPFNLNAAEAILAQCEAAGVAAFVKQLGARPTVSDLTHWRCPADLLPDGSGYLLKLKDDKGGDADEWPKHLRIRQFPEVRAA